MPCCACVVERRAPVLNATVPRRMHDRRPSMIRRRQPPRRPGAAGHPGLAAGFAGAAAPRAASRPRLDQRRDLGFTRAASGHCYFTLKDADGAGALRALPAEGAGLGVALTRRARRRSSRHADDLRGARRLPAQRRDRPPGRPGRALRALRPAEGAARSRRLVRRRPQAPAAGVSARRRHRHVDARGGAVGRSDDAARRWPAARVIVYPTAVQGDGAAADIAAAIALANAAARRRRADRRPRRRLDRGPVVVQRGGGRARSVRVGLPVVSGVGHETDFTICDFVADVRAPTPTGAAALVVPDRAAFAHRVEPIARHWRARRARAGRASSASITRRGASCIPRPVSRQQRNAPPRWRSAWRALRGAGLSRQRNASRRWRAASWRAARAAAAGARVERLRDALAPRGARRLARARRASTALAQSLAHLNPRAVLERGYAIVTTPTGTSSTTARSSRRAMPWRWRSRAAARRRVTDVSRLKPAPQDDRRGVASVGQAQPRGPSRLPSRQLTLRSSFVGIGILDGAARRRATSGGAAAAMCGVAVRTSAFCARWRNAWSISTSAIIASAIGVARMPTHGSWRPCVLTMTARPALSIECRSRRIELVGLTAIVTTMS